MIFQECIFAYHGQKLGALPPHVFALAEASYKNLQTESTNQGCNSIALKKGPKISFPFSVPFSGALFVLLNQD